MSFIKVLADWNAIGVDPPQTLKDAGWQAEQKPPADYFNWYMYNTYQALLEFQQKAGEVKKVNGSSPNSNGEVTVSVGVTSVNGAAGAVTDIETTSGALSKIEQASFKKIKSIKDANGIYTTVEHRRKSDNTLVRKSVLSGGTSPLYTTRTITYYAANGTTVAKTEIFTLTYDTDGTLTSEV